MVSGKLVFLSLAYISFPVAFSNIPSSYLVINISENLYSKHSRIIKKSNSKTSKKLMNSTGNFVQYLPTVTMKSVKVELDSFPQYPGKQERIIYSAMEREKY